MNQTHEVNAVCCSACRFQQMLHVMQDGMPETQIIILGLYPRGADFGDNRFQWPNHFTYPIELLNALYQVTHRPAAPTFTGAA